MSAFGIVMVNTGARSAACHLVRQACSVRYNSLFRKNKFPVPSKQIPCSVQTKSLLPFKEIGTHVWFAFRDDQKRAKAEISLLAGNGQRARVREAVGKREAIEHPQFCPSSIKSPQLLQGQALAMASLASSRKSSVFRSGRESI